MVLWQPMFSKEITTYESNVNCCHMRKDYSNKYNKK